MKRMLAIAALAGLLCTVGAAATEISIDYRRDTDFSKYKTFAFQPGVPAADANMHQFILGKLEALLTAAGLQKVDSLEKADLHVLYTVAVEQGVKTDVVQTRQPMTGLPKWDYESLQGSGSLVRHQEISEGTLAVDIEEGATSKLLWHGVATETFAEAEGFEAAQKVVDSVLGLMLRKFPPKPQKPAAK
jgi:hypothetical protein